MNKLSKSQFFNDPQNIIAVGVTVISLCALLVSLVQTRLLHEERELIREQSRASVWPYIEFNYSKSHNYDRSISKFSFTLSNNGVGPAIITDVKVTYKDSVASNWWELFRIQEIPDSIKPFISNQGFNKMVLPTGKTLQILNLDNNLPLANG